MTNLEKRFPGCLEGISVREAMNERKGDLWDQRLSQGAMVRISLLNFRTSSTFPILE